MCLWPMEILTGTTLVHTLARHLKADREGNCADANFVHVDSARNVIFDVRAKKNRNPIAVVGLRDCVIVQTDDTTLVAHKKATAKCATLWLSWLRIKLTANSLNPHPATRDAMEVSRQVPHPPHRPTAPLWLDSAMMVGSISNSLASRLRLD